MKCSHAFCRKSLHTCKVIDSAFPISTFPFLISHFSFLIFHFLFLISHFSFLAPSSTLAPQHNENLLIYFAFRANYIIFVKQTVQKTIFGKGYKSILQQAQILKTTSNE